MEVVDEAGIFGALLHPDGVAFTHPLGRKVAKPYFCCSASPNSVPCDAGPNFGGILCMAGCGAARAQMATSAAAPACTLSAPCAHGGGLAHERGPTVIGNGAAIWVALCEP